MSSVYGENLKLSIFGRSHGPAIGMTLDGIPAGLPVDTETLRIFLDRRAPGNTPWSTARKEADMPEFLDGLLDGHTCGSPIAAIIRNSNVRSSDYDAIKDRPRPGHADYTAHIKHGGFQDASGGGHFSGRLTAALCIAGGLCLQWLDEMGISVRAHILQIGPVKDQGFDPCASSISPVDVSFPTIDPDCGKAMQELIASIKEYGDSIGGTIECIVSGLPAGVGEPIFGGIENRLAQILFGIPGVKGVDFGDDILLGSQYNDAFIYTDGVVKTSTNHCGGILGGISNGMNILFRVRVKPTPSISAEQQTVSLSARETAKITVGGRHDPCIVPRAVPVVEAAAAIAIYDMILGNTQTKRRKG